ELHRRVFEPKAIGARLPHTFLIYGNGAEHTHQQRCPSREWRGPFQDERPCDFEKICEKDEEPRHRLSLDEDSERRALDGPRVLKSRPSSERSLSCSASNPKIAGQTHVDGTSRAS